MFIMFIAYFQHAPKSYVKQKTQIIEVFLRTEHLKPKDKRLKLQSFSMKKF